MHYFQLLFRSKPAKKEPNTKSDKSLEDFYLTNEPKIWPFTVSSFQQQQHYLLQQQLHHTTHTDTHKVCYFRSVSRNCIIGCNYLPARHRARRRKKVFIFVNIFHASAHRYLSFSIFCISSFSWNKFGICSKMLVFWGKVALSRFNNQDTPLPYFWLNVKGWKNLFSYPFLTEQTP